MEISMLFILDIIISFTQITGGGGSGVPHCGLKAKGVDTQSETGNTANGISWEVKEKFAKVVGRKSSQSLFGGQCTPSVVSENFAVVLSWAAVRIGCLKLQESTTKRLRSMDSQGLQSLHRSMDSQFRSFS